MTVAALASKIDYLENGVTTSFAVPFRFLSGTVTASRVLADGTVVVLASGTNFSTTGGETDAGGFLALTGASVSGARLRIRRVTPRAQVANYVPDDSFPAASHEQALDRSMLVDQEQDDKIADTAARALMVPDGETAPTLETKDERAGRFPVWSIDGEQLVSSQGTGADLGLREDLADPDLGASLVARALITGDVNLGNLPSGSTNGIDISRTVAQGAADGTTQFYSFVHRTFAQGANNFDFVRGAYLGTHVNTSAGTTNEADGIHVYVWQAGAGNITNIQGIASHVRVDGPGDVTNEAVNFRAASTTLGGGAAIGTAKGVSIGQIGHATQVTNVYGFDVEDQQASSVVIGYRSTISAGANKYFLFGAGTAASAFGGAVGIGMTSTPPWKLTVQEPASANIADFSSSHASSPFGIRVRYTAANPNDNDHDFLLCSSSAGNKLRIYSTGSVVNATNSYGAISDAKLKRDIRDAGPQLADIRAVRLRKYKLIADGDDAVEHLGVIAQELEQVSPGLVSDAPDMELVYEPAYERGGVGEPDFIPLIGMGEWKERPAGTFTKSVNYSVLYLKGVKALQELAEEVDGLKARLATLDGGVAA